MDGIFVGIWQNVRGGRYKITVSLSHQKDWQGHIERQRPCLSMPNEIQKINITLDVSINQKIMDKVVRQYIYLQF
jgi:hypothetical protein